MVVSFGKSVSGNGEGAFSSSFLVRPVVGSLLLFVGLFVIVCATKTPLSAKHPGVEEIIQCEIDEGVINVSKKYLPSLAKGFEDPRVSVNIMDGAKFMEENQDSFDVIITDSSDREWRSFS